MVNDLIFDIGMHNGDDAAYYLSRGFRVVSVEANPVLAARGRERFAREIADGRLTIEHGAITGAGGGPLTFWVNEVNDEWSSTDRAVAGRDGTPHHPVEVPSLSTRQLFETYGVPWYLKSDIERGDIHVLEALERGNVPRYLSIEAHSVEYFAWLWVAGYRHFKIVDQMRHNLPPLPFSNESLFGRSYRTVDHYVTGGVRVLRRKLGRPAGRHAQGTSGPFGEETPGEWKSLDEVSYELLHWRWGHRDRGTLDMRSWFDIHARLP